jgi:hypothetical protein
MSEKIKLKYTAVYEIEVDPTTYGEPEGEMRNSIILEMEKEQAGEAMLMAIENGDCSINVEIVS